jgi:hypothetical protein
MLRKTILFIYLISCLSIFGQGERTDLSSFFSKSEITDLNLIADFLQAELCGKSDRTEFASCIKNSLPDLADWKQYYLQEKLSWSKQKKLYSKITDSTFSKIWSLCDTWRVKEPKYEYKSICFSQNEKFIQFLKALGKSNPYLEYYGKRLENVGAFDSGNFLVWDIIKNPQNWNLEDRNVQIVLAIHFLTQNDWQKRDKKSIRLENRDLKKLNRATRRKNK